MGRRLGGPNNRRFPAKIRIRRQAPNDPPPLRSEDTFSEGLPNFGPGTKRQAEKILSPKSAKMWLAKMPFFFAFAGQTFVKIAPKKLREEPEGEIRLLCLHLAAQQKPGEPGEQSVEQSISLLFLL